jgi:hypothetical protein
MSSIGQAREENMAYIETTVTPGTWRVIDYYNSDRENEPMIMARISFVSQKLT